LLRFAGVIATSLVSSFFGDMVYSSDISGTSKCHSAGKASLNRNVESSQQISESDTAFPIYARREFHAVAAAASNK